MLTLQGRWNYHHLPTTLILTPYLLCVRVSVRVCVCVYVYLSICLSEYLSVCLSVY